MSFVFNKMDYMKVNMVETGRNLIMETVTLLLDNGTPTVNKSSDERDISDMTELHKLKSMSAVKQNN